MQIYEASRIFKKEKKLNMGLAVQGVALPLVNLSTSYCVLIVAHVDSPLVSELRVHVCVPGAMRTWFSRAHTSTHAFRGPGVCLPHALQKRQPREGRHFPQRHLHAPCSGPQTR